MITELFSPDSFGWAPLPWHAQSVSHLARRRRANTLAHAFLVKGPAGCGSDAFAAAAAALLLCREPGETACGQCESCQLLTGGAHGDLRWLSPLEGKRAISIESVRGGIDFLQQTAGYGVNKVLVISPAEAMTTSAANALLKTLEEPSANSIILLVSDRPGDLPATVRSRCQPLVLPQPEDNSAQSWLAGEAGIDGEAAAELLDSHAARVVDALIAAQGGTAEHQVIIRETLGALIRGQGSPQQAVAALGEFPLEDILDSAVLLVDAQLRRSDGSSALHSMKGLFATRRELLGWLRGVRRGINLAREALLLAVCRRLDPNSATDAVTGSKT